MKLLGSCLFIWIFIFSSLVFAGDWQHLKLWNDFATINVDYQTKETALVGSFITSACPLYINVSYPNLKENDDVIVILKNKGSDRGSNRINSYRFKLVYSKNHFTMLFHDQFLNDSCLEIDRKAINFDRSFEQEILVEINGEEMIDPISRNTGFKFNLLN